MDDDDLINESASFTCSLTDSPMARVYAGTASGAIDTFTLNDDGSLVLKSTF